MFEPISISEAIPRSGILTFKEFSGAYTASLIMGGIFCFLGLASFISSTAMGTTLSARIFFVVLTLGSAFWLYRTYQKITHQQEVFEKGRIVQAKVIGHKRAFNPFKSSRDYGVEVESETGIKIVLVHSSKGLWTHAPVGKQLIGLEWEGAWLFGESMDISFEIETKK